MLTVATRRHGDATTVVAADGELDCYSSALLRAQLIAHTRAGHALIVDLTGVTFIDSAGLGVLVGAWKLFREIDGTLAFVAGPGVSRRIAVTRLDQVFRIYPTLAEALADPEAVLTAGACA
jgi:anti-sigma B factor antagonist